ncbi:MAG: adenylate/guanylate cyclase domain-containing protein [Cyanobacteria bacterium P01_D01_bin.1]
MTKSAIALPQLQSRLSRQVTIWVFLSIVVIEGIVFVPSYFRRRVEALRALETISQEVLNSTKAEIVNAMPEQQILSQIQLKEGSLIKGVALHDANGQLVDSVGEPPAFGADVFAKPAPATPSWVSMAIRSDTTMPAVRRMNPKGDRYDIAWPNEGEQLPYQLAIRHDATIVQREMRRYALGVMGLVIIISAFVTIMTLLVVQRIIIRPLLLLRDDLSMAGEALAQGDSPNFASLQRPSPNELGEVAVVFQTMFNRIKQEICDRQEAESDLRSEQEKTNQLLLNILPAAIATQLKENQAQAKQGKAIAQRFETATVLFADIVKFTELAADTEPTVLVQQLNDIFSAFDAIAQRHRLEKIKTIGDAYMVVGGVPSVQPNHAEAMVEMAIEMMQFARSYSLETPTGTHHLRLRIGINTGPVVAGVIGIQKFSYDLWGDTVNIASRMESHGIVDRIQVSEDTYLHLKDIYLFEDRGYLPIKGRGEMRAFLLTETPL